MKDDIESRIKKAESLASAGEEGAAMVIADELVERLPNSRAVWSLRAYLHGRNGEYVAAVADLTQAIEIATDDTFLFLARGKEYLRLGEDNLALADFSRGLELCDFHGSDCFRATLHFLRAEALVGLGRTEEALLDLAPLPDDFQYWTYKLRTKAELVAECKQGKKGS